MLDQSPIFRQIKATKLEQIDAAVDKFSPVKPGDPFYVDFANLRGDYQERDVISVLNVRQHNGQYLFNVQLNQNNKTLLFLDGMRGSVKTTELAKYTQKLHHSQCFFVVTCNIDEGLDLDNVQYMDIVVFQLEQLINQADVKGLQLNKSIIEQMEGWFAERIKEINQKIKSEGGIEIEVGNPNSVVGLFSNLLGLTGKLKLGLSGSVERAQNIRNNLKNNFVDFAAKFNLFIEQTNAQLRAENKGQEVLFIIDGLEKTMTADMRKKIILDEANRIRSIKANTIFTLPIELMKETQRIRNFAEVISFPFIKIKTRGSDDFIPAAYNKFKQFITKRIDDSLFASEDVIKLAIEYSGGLPRQLLRIIENAARMVDDVNGKISLLEMNRALDKLGNDMARYIEPKEFIGLKRIKQLNANNEPIGFDSDLIQVLLEKELLMEYNDGTDKRVNPLLNRAKLYLHHTA